MTKEAYDAIVIFDRGYTLGALDGFKLAMGQRSSSRLRRILTKITRETDPEVAAPNGQFAEGPEMQHPLPFNGFSS
jgi:hypothetical protein